VAIPNRETLFAAIDIRTKTHHIAQIQDELAKAEESEIKLSVIICTYKGGERLIDCVESVTTQRFPVNDFEIIVVNNDPDQNSIHQQISEIGKEGSLNDQGHLRFVHCPFLGLSYARNIGIGEARGEVICFMDDDAIADSNWLQRIWDAFGDHPMAGVIGGPIILRQPDPKPSWMKSGWKRYWSHLNPDYSSYTEVEHWWKFPWGANWCARRRALLEIGGFRTEYGRRGSDYAGGEEIIAASLIQKLGYKIAIEPHAKILHAVAQDRFTRKHIWNTILNVRRTWFKAHRDQYFSREVSMPTTLRRLFDSINKESLFITVAELNAELHFMAWRLNDWLLRFRQPLSKR
jgi:glycosyltransferase involved in cell wall biosynthesis